MVDNIVNFAEAQARRENCPAYKDDSGVMWYPYSISYECDGKNFGIEVWAIDDTHAGKVVQSLRNAKLNSRILYSENSVG